jgi:hypothetical protein
MMTAFLVGLLIGQVRASVPPWLTVRVQAVRCADDDGRHVTPIEPAQVGLWLAEANRVYAAGRIRFVFDPEQDFTDLRDTRLNRLMPGVSAAAGWERGVALARRFPGKMTVLFRYGDGEGPTGNGYSSGDSGVVVLCGFESTSVCGHQNLSLFAHEVGHYFGLDHTFAREFKTAAEAETFLKEHGGDPRVFDGDGLSDTAPDPQINPLGCQAPADVTLGGTTLRLPRDNVMGYYDHAPKTLSTQQANRVRWLLRARQACRMLAPANEPDSRHPIVEFETADLERSSGVGGGPGPKDPWNSRRWSGGKIFFAAGKPGDRISLTFSTPRRGRYRVVLYATRAPDYGRVTVALDHRPPGRPIDFYAPVVCPTGKILLGTLVAGSPRHRLTIQLVDRNPESKNDYLGLDALEVAPQPGEGSGNVTENVLSDVPLSTL